jgi:hypothetical protein
MARDIAWSALLSSGLMDGEAVDMWKKGELEVEEFEIV